jgi:hypothetical protein
MFDLTMHGWPVRRIATSESCWTNPSPRYSLTFSATFHGDHDEFWVMKFDVIDQQIVAHYNARTLHAIEWEAPTPPTVTVEAPKDGR